MSSFYKQGFCSVLQRLINHLCIQNTLKFVLLFVCFPIFLLTPFEGIFLDLSPIIGYSFACQRVRSGLTVSSNSLGPLLLIQCFISTVSTLPFSCCCLGVRLNSDPSSSRGTRVYQVPQGSEIHFSCPEPLYQKQTPKPCLRTKREL